MFCGGVGGGGGGGGRLCFVVMLLAGLVRDDLVVS